LTAGCTTVRFQGSCMVNSVWWKWSQWDIVYVDIV
jgi:hypothetical protein